MAKLKTRKCIPLHKNQSREMSSILLLHSSCYVQHLSCWVGHPAILTDLDPVADSHRSPGGDPGGIPVQEHARASGKSMWPALRVPNTSHQPHRTPAPSAFLTSSTRQVRFPGTAAVSVFHGKCPDFGMLQWKFNGRGVVGGIPRTANLEWAPFITCLGSDNVCRASKRTSEFRHIQLEALETFKIAIKSKNAYSFTTRT